MDNEPMDTFNPLDYEFPMSPSFTFDTSGIDAFNDSLDDRHITDPMALHTGDAIVQRSSRRSSPHDTSSESPRNSIDSSDNSTGNSQGGKTMVQPGRIMIKAEASEGPHQSWNGSPEEPSTLGNDLFDFDSAASSPVNLNTICHAQRQKGFRTGQFNPLTSRTQGAYGHGVYEGSSLSITAREPRSPHRRTIPEPKPQFVTEASLQKQASLGRNTLKFRKSPSPGSVACDSMDSELPQIHISALPKTQRVETQMHTRLTIYPLPPGIKQLHFQGYTMARTKLVTKPPPEKSSTMLELYAHCVCATAMEDPDKLQKALVQAAQSTREDSRNGGDGTPTSRDLSMSDADPRKPMNGGFVFICDQCIRRENKRIARKKLKNEAEEESWLDEQPKRIIVFNKAEVMEWQNWRTYEGDDEPEDSSPGPSNTPNFPNEAMQIRFPMRIQCYSRHHGEKLGYRVIFTIKDWQDRVIAQSLTSPVIITDDHKAQHTTRSSIGSASQAPVMQPISLENAANFEPQNMSDTSLNFHALLGSRNSFSTPNLQSLQRRTSKSSHKSRPSSNFSTQSQVNTAGRPGSQNDSRPASPNAAEAPQIKRRKGSGSSTGKMRSELTMTKISHQGPRSTVSNGNSRRVDVTPFTPTGSILHGLTTPPATAKLDCGQMTPSLFDGSDFQTGQRSVTTSAWSSRAPSPEPTSQVPLSTLLPPTVMPTTEGSISAHFAVSSGPIIHKVTPAKGSKSGGIEVTCLGESFSPGTEVFFGNIPAATKSLWGNQALLCLLPPAATSGVVHVTARNVSNGQLGSIAQENVSFLYTDQDEEELMRHALQIINRQFAGAPAQAQEFARKILSSYGGDSNGVGGLEGGMSSGNHQQRGASLEDLVLKCLDMVDLDDHPNLVDLNFRNSNGQGILHVSASLGSYRLVAGLLARGAHADLQDNNGMTPMHLASINGHTKIIRKLRYSGADPCLRSLNGTRPADLAGSMVVRDLIESLRFHSRFSSRNRSTVPTLPESDGVGMRSLPDLGSLEMHRTNFETEGSPTTNLLSDTKLPTGTEPGSTATNKHLEQQAAAEHSVRQLAGHSALLLAWRDQISAQIQQLQQNLHRALPIPMPNLPPLPDYQQAAYPMMRRISSLVPQRNVDSGTGDKKLLGLDENEVHVQAMLRAAEDYSWWELINPRPNTSPPPYEEIYPTQSPVTDETQTQTLGSQQTEVRNLGTIVEDHHAKTQHESRKTSVVGPHSSILTLHQRHQQPKRDTEPSNTVRTQDSCAKSDSTDRRTLVGTGTLVLTGTQIATTTRRRQAFREAHARKLKRLSSHRKLFFVWLPFIVLLFWALVREWGSSDVIDIGVEV